MFELIKEYPTLSAAIGMASVTVIGMGRQFLTMAVSKLSGLYKHEFSIDSDNVLFSSLLQYIKENVRGVRSFKVTNFFAGDMVAHGNWITNDFEYRELVVNLIPENIAGILRLGGVLYIIRVSATESRIAGTGTNSLTTQKTRITITAFTSDLEKAKLIFEQVNNRNRARESKALKYCNSKGAIYILRDQNVRERKNLRHFENLAVKACITEELIADIRKFMDAQDTYHRTGCTWKRIYLLHGPSGTGKTSLAMAAANHFRSDIYYIQMGLIRSGSFSETLNQCGKFKFILIDDITSSGLDLSDSEESVKASESLLLRQPTLAEILTGLDGPDSPEAQIIFITTNHINRLSDNFVRTGRIDKAFLIGNAGQEEQRKIAAMYYDTVVPGVDAYIKPSRVVEIVRSAESAEQAQAALEVEVVNNPGIGYEQEYTVKLD